MNKYLKTITAVAAIAVLTLALPFSTQAQGALRSGTILAVSADTSDVTWIWPWKGCGGSLECWGWVQSYCDPALAGRDVAVMSSIEPVSDMANGLTRKLRFRSPAGLSSGRLIVEFWTSNCGFLPVNAGEGHIDCSVECPDFTIPDRAHWMTITSKPGNANINWDLS